jgi:FAD:protein FMN transferase
MKIRSIAIQKYAFALLLSLLAACEDVTAEVVRIEGLTMGSRWSVQIVGVRAGEAARLRAGMQAEFERVDAALSTYRLDSALSRFNDGPGDVWQPLSQELVDVLGAALLFASISDGAYDVTVGPLVDLWGFGPAPARNVSPTAADIAAARARVGWQQIEFDVVGRRARKPVDVRVDLSSLGKGYGVDQVAAWLEAQGIHNYLIDLSGKLRAAGRNARGKPWRIGVEVPGPDGAAGEVRVTQHMVELREGSIATAGDYRRYFQSGGRVYSHLIDPRTGYPVAHGATSATVRVRTCLEADAWATLLMVVPLEQALQIAQLHAVPALLFVRSNEGVASQITTDWLSKGTPWETWISA